MERLGSVQPWGDDEHRHRGARRQSQRWPVLADAELLAPVAAAGIVINISCGGLRVAFDRVLEEGQECVLRVHTQNDRVFTEHARVVWRQVHPDGCIAGLEFTSVAGN